MQHQTANPLKVFGNMVVFFINYKDVTKVRLQTNQYASNHLQVSLDTKNAVCPFSKIGFLKVSHNANHYYIKKMRC